MYLLKSHVVQGKREGIKVCRSIFLDNTWNGDKTDT